MRPQKENFKTLKDTLKKWNVFLETKTKNVRCQFFLNGKHSYNIKNIGLFPVKFMQKNVKNLPGKFLKEH